MAGEPPRDRHGSEKSGATNFFESSGKAKMRLLDY
jgi:hypothetical protein